MTISGENCRDLLDVYSLASSMDIELANAVVHNSFYFHKENNEIKNVEEVEQVMLDFMAALLSSPRKNLKRRMKRWENLKRNMDFLQLQQYLEQVLLRVEVFSLQY